jgi:D-amino-acid dehydrogenase
LLLGERHIAVAPLGDEVRISGGFEIGRNDLDVSSRQVRRLMMATRERVDVEIDTVGVVPWAGRRPVSADGLPIIGYSPASARVVLATGHQMVGLSFAPGTARAVAGLVRGDDPGMDLRVFDPRRFGPR